MGIECISSNRIFSFNELPKKTKYEVAVIGRSNVGKSSLINAIFNTNISRTSKTPGCTVWIGVYEMKNALLFDLPGYGYAQKSQSVTKRCEILINSLLSSQRLNELWILIDSRRNVQLIDEVVIQSAISFEIPCKLIATKCDKKISSNTNYDFITSTRVPQTLRPLIQYTKKLVLTKESML